MTNKFLENEKIALEEKITEARKQEKENTYKNLIQAYERVLELIRKENVWTDMYSHYKMKIDDEFQEVVSTWKQKGEDIKDHKIYKIEKEIVDKPTYKLYYDLECRDDNLFKCTIYFKDNITGIVGNFEYLSRYISNICANENVSIHGDIRGFGMGLADHLKELGYVVKATVFTINDVTRNISKETKQDYSKTRE